MRVKSTQRSCPTCRSDEFEMADCQEGRQKLNGYTVMCLNCNWQGFKLQLLPKPDIAQTNEVVGAINEEVAKGAQKEGKGLEK